MKIKIPHFLEYPERVLTRQERIIQRRGNQMDLKFGAYYALFLILIFSAISIGSLFASRNDGKSEIEELYQKICFEHKDSVFCTDRALFDRYVEASKKKGVPPSLVFGIMYAESSLHTNYNKPICKDYGNPFGLKGRKNDDGSVDWYERTERGADKNGCWLFRFGSLEEGLNGLLNTLSIGYKKCEYDVRCISFAYVGHPEKSEQSWVDRVSKFYVK